MAVIDAIYGVLSKIGYTHPLHPALTHLPVGMVIGAFLFTLTAILIRRPALLQTARHCRLLAIIALPPTMILGFMDWQHFYGGAWLFPIIMKLILGGTLLIILFSLEIINMTSPKILISYGISLLTVVVIGFFGGELVYGKKAATSKIDDSLVQQGVEIFAQRCAVCHFTDSTETKVGPGLKGVFRTDTLPISGRPVSEKNIRRQLKTPFKNMPPIKDLSQNEIDAIISYLKTL